MRGLSGLILLWLLIAGCRKEDQAEKMPYIDFSYQGNTGNLPVTVSFTSYPNAEGEVRWDFGDGHTGTGTTVTHTYDTAGYYTVYVQLSALGNTAGKTRKINISPFRLMRISKISGQAPFVNANGTNWDTDPQNTAPDPFYRVFDALGNETGHQSGYFILNNTFINETIYNPSIIISDLEGSFKVVMLDYDPGSAADEIMGTFYFRPIDYFSGNGNFATSLTKTDSVTTASVTLTVQWTN